MATAKIADVQKNAAAVQELQQMKEQMAQAGPPQGAPEQPAPGA
jgi:hypothetical protein